jgi:hypothetical protein
MSRGEKVSARRQAAQIERHSEIGTKTPDICESPFGCFTWGTVTIGGDGKRVIATRTEVRKDHMSSDKATRKDYCQKVVVSVPRVVPAGLRSIVTATGADWATWAVVAAE